MPDWVRADLTVSKLQVGGIDPVSGKRFLVTAFSGSETLSVPRSAAGSARFLVAGPARVGNIDRALVTLASATLIVPPPGGTGSPRVIPIAVQDNALKFQPAQPVALAAGETRSLVGTIRLGKEAVLTKQGTLALKPTPPTTVFAAPGPENYLDGNEVLVLGPTTEFPELAVRVQRSKLIDQVTGVVRDLTLDLQQNAPVSYSELRGRDGARWRQNHGALRPSLVSELASKGSEDLVTVDVMVRTQGAPPTLITSASTPEGWRAAHADFVAAREAAAADAVAATVDALTAAGAVVLGQQLHPAVVTIQAPRHVIEEVAHLGSVLRVQGRSAVKNVIATTAATDLAQQPLQELADVTGVGAGMVLALIEDQACINEDHAAFPDMTFEKLDPCGSGGVSIWDGHSTLVAGALVGDYGSTSPPPGRVGLVGAKVLVANQCELIPDKVLERGPHVVTNSCLEGTIDVPLYVNDSDQFGYDQAVYADRIFVASGAGNLSAMQEWSQFPVQCTSYNAVCVGGYNNGGTAGPTKYVDDVPTYRSRNDPLTNLEKPDLVAPSNALLPHHLYDGEYRAVDGTSFSTPFVAGTAALLMASYPESLLGNPTLVRAVLMASASHSFQNHRRVPSHTDDVDDRVGAGAPRGDRAKEIMDNGRFYSAYIDRSTDFNSAGDLNVPLSFSAPQGSRVRIVMTYDHCPTSDVTAVYDDLLADLDLTVYDNRSESLGYIHTNNSHVDNTEIVELYLMQGSNFTLKVKSQFWDACGDGTRKTHIAIAWDHFYVGDLPADDE